jgi:hypothetical protein
MLKALFQGWLGEIREQHPLGSAGAEWWYDVEDPMNLVKIGSYH